MKKKAKKITALFLSFIAAFSLSVFTASAQDETGYSNNEKAIFLLGLPLMDFDDEACTLYANCTHNHGEIPITTVTTEYANASFCKRVTTVTKNYCYNCKIHKSTVTIIATTPHEKILYNGVWICKNCGWGLW